MMNTLIRRGFLVAILGALATVHISAQIPLVVTDALGREIRFESSPERIVIAGPATLMIADALYLFDSGPRRLVGVTRIDQGKGNFLRALDSDYDAKTILQRQVGPEQIAALRPDAVLLKSQVRARLGVRLEALGIPVVYFDFESPGQYSRDIAAMARLLEEEDRGREIIDYIEAKRQEVLRITSSIPLDVRPSVLFLYVDNRGGNRAFNVPPDRWIQTTLVQDAGGVPVWTGIPLGGGWTTVTLEQIAFWNPDVIFVVAYRQNVTDVEDALDEDPVWESLTAVQLGNTHAVPVDYYSWDQPDIRWVLGLRWMATVLQPEEYRSWDIRSDVYNFYNELYGLSRAETDRIIFSVLQGSRLSGTAN